MTETEVHDAGSEIRKQARERVEKRRDFKTHVFIYCVVNAALIAIWAIATPDSFFWPVFVLFGWGIGVAGNAWDVYFRKPVTEAEIDREEERLREKRVVA